MNERVFNKNVDKLRTAERIERLEIDRVIKLITGSGVVESVLDIGTGSGLFAEAFYNNKLKVAGVDINPEMIKIVKEQLPDCEFKTAPAELLPFDDNIFDITFMGQVLHEADDHLQAIKEAGRVAKLSVWVLEWPYKAEEYGPPLEHRLSSEFVSDIAARAKFKSIETIQLKSMVLYRLNKI